MPGYGNFDELLHRAAAYAVDLQIAAKEKVGPDRHEVQGIWLHPHPSDDNPYFIDENGAVYQAMYMGDVIEDDNGCHPQPRQVQVYPEAERGVRPLDRLKLLSALQTYFGTQARTEGAAKAEAFAIMKEALDAFRLEM